MSLGPSYVRLTARNPNFFDDVSNTLTQITQNANSASVPQANVPQDPSASPGTLQQVGEVTGLSSVFPINGGVTGPFSVGKYNDNFHKRVTIVGRDQKKGDNKFDGLFGTLSGSFAPSGFFSHFFKRDGDDTINPLRPVDAMPGNDRVNGLPPSSENHPHGLPPPLVAGLYSPNSYFGSFAERDHVTGRDTTEGESPDEATGEPSIITDQTNEGAPTGQDQTAEDKTNEEQPHILNFNPDDFLASFAPGFAPDRYFPSFHKRMIAGRLILDNLDSTFEDRLNESDNDFDVHTERSIGSKPAILGHAHRDLDSRPSRTFQKMHRALQAVSARELD